MRIFLRKLLTVTAPTLLLFGIVLEMFFRFIIPACEVPFVYFDPLNRIMRYDERYQRNGLYTIGPAAHRGGRWHINNAGWNSEIDYDEHSKAPLIAVIGDSYVEAFGVNVNENFASLLRGKLPAAYRVYSFGISGAPLSQYLQMSRYVRRRFHPSVLVISVVHNDFDESMSDANAGSPFFLRFQSDKDGKFRQVDPIPYTPNRWKRMLKPSALARYLYENLHVYELLNGAGVERDEHYAANVNVGAVNAKQTVIQNLTDQIVRNVRDENPGIPVIFMIDALRQEIYDPGFKSNLEWMTETLKQSANENDCYFLDLTTAFKEDYEKNRLPFNPPYDWHWNRHGHSVAARALFEALQRILNFSQN